MTTEEVNSVLANIDDLGFLSPEKTELLLGAIIKMHPTQKRNAVSKLTQNRMSAGGANLSPRDEAMMRIGMLPEDIRKGLADKRLQLVDAVYYIRKAAGASTFIKMITNGDTKVVGTSNLSAGKFDKDGHFLLTHIRLQTGVSATAITDAPFSTPEKGVLNGQVEFKCGSKYILPNEVSARIFDTTGLTEVTPGTFRLSNPKWLEPQQAIEFNLSLAQAAAANTWISVEMVGVAVSPF